MDTSLTEEEMNECLDNSRDKLHAEEGTKMMNLMKALHHYKDKNPHLNHFNDHLVQANQISREDLEEINTNYVELVQDVEEAIKRRNLAQERNEELCKKN